jgi:quercetin dioxygenase-like cupin family protein
MQSQEHEPIPGMTQNPSKQYSEPGRVPAPPVRRARVTEGCRWDDVDLKHYKPVGTHFRDITRQVLFGEAENLPSELRYFEIGPGGYSTFERHQHVHAVMIIHGCGEAVVGSEVHPLERLDLVHVPPMTWHQFHAAADSALGFLCLVACDRDRPQRPTDEEVAALQADPAVGSRIRL